MVNQVNLTYQVVQILFYPLVTLFIYSRRKVPRMLILAAPILLIVSQAWVLVTTLFELSGPLDISRLPFVLAYLLFVQTVYMIFGGLDVWWHLWSGGLVQVCIIIGLLFLV